MRLGDGTTGSLSSILEGLGLDTGSLGSILGGGGTTPPTTT